MTAKKIGIKFRKKGFSLNDFRRGMQVELEHGRSGGKQTNVTSDDLVKTGRIALAHLNEGANYYDLLTKLEKRLHNKRG